MVSKLCIFQKKQEIWEVFIFRIILIFTLTETSFATISYSFTFFLIVCKSCQSGLKIINYILEVSRCTNIIYTEKYLVLIYTERLFSATC